jgi:ribosomal-protein-alanine N-acetyltransferase
MAELNLHPLPAITTTRLVLRPMRPDDAPEVFILRSDARILRYLTIAPAKTLDDALSFIEKITGYIQRNETAFYGITTKETDKLIGTCTIWNLQPQNRRAEVGYALHPDYWGKGLAPEALAALIDFGFNVMKLHSLEAHVAPENTASIRVLEKTGFVKEAHFRENHFHEGKFFDSAVYSLLNKNDGAPSRN